MKFIALVALAALTACAHVPSEYVEPEGSDGPKPRDSGAIIRNLIDVVQDKLSEL